MGDIISHPAFATTQGISSRRDTVCATGIAFFEIDLTGRCRSALEIDGESPGFSYIHFFRASEKDGLIDVLRCSYCHHLTAIGTDKWSCLPRERSSGRGPGIRNRPILETCVSQVVVDFATCPQTDERMQKRIRFRRTGKIVILIIASASNAPHAELSRLIDGRDIHPADISDGGRPLEAALNTTSEVRFEVVSVPGLRHYSASPPHVGLRARAVVDRLRRIPCRVLVIGKLSRDRLQLQAQPVRLEAPCVRVRYHAFTITRGYVPRHVHPRVSERA